MTPGRGARCPTSYPGGHEHAGHGPRRRLRRGMLLGHEGRVIADEARRAMRDEAIAEPDAMARMLCPSPFAETFAEA